MKRLFLVLIFFLSPPLSLPADVSVVSSHLKKYDVKLSSVSVIKKIRYSNSPKRTRIVIDITHPVSYQVIRISEAQKLVLHLDSAILGKSLIQQPFQVVKGKLIKNIEAKQSGKGTVELSLTYKHLGAHKAMLLKKPNRLVLDLYPPPVPTTNPFEIQTIVIDPGHGGKDPGATSRKGLKEKDIVLDISRRLKKLIEKHLKKKVILTRNSDVFISLKKRTEIANKNHADLFISVHVNSAASHRLRGIEVYLLGRASSKRALATARRENAASHKAASSLQKMILNDLERDFTQNASLELAHFTNNAIKKTLISKYPTPALGVKKAPFYVLSHTEMPAILAEMSFISNLSEEKRLRSKSYRQQAAKSLFKGLADYIKSSQAGN